MMKKACILLVCLALLVACLPPLTVGADAAVAEGTCGDGVHWTLSDGGTLTLSGTGPMTDYSYPVKPSNYSTKLDISQCAPWYAHRLSIDKVVIEQGITSIGNYAFSDCRNLTAADIPDTVTGIGRFAFNECTALREVTIPEGVTQIGYRAFCTCESLTNVTIPEGVSVIAQDLFSYCISLIHVTIPEGVTTIENYAFSGCKNLTDVVLPKSLTSIGQFALSGCYNMKSVTFLGHAPSIGGWVFSADTATVYYPCGDETWDSVYKGNYQGTMTWVGHVFGDHVIQQEATCTENAIATGTCSVCGATETVSVPGTATGHDYAGGVRCVTCGHAVEIVVYMHLRDGYHDWYGVGVEVYANDELLTVVTEEGYEYSTKVRIPCAPCTRYTLVWERGDLGACVEIEISMDGKLLVSGPGDTFADRAVLYTLENVSSHQYGDVITTPPTCTEDGSTVGTCVSCGADLLIETLPATGHSFQDGVCTACGALGALVCSHSFARGQWVTQPTCTEKGQKSYTCNLCGYVKYATFNATGHSLQTTAVAPDCTTEGYDLHQCQNCDYSFRDNPVPATGHSYLITETAPGCTQPGHELHQCENCSHYYMDNITPPIGHSYENGVCTLCGQRIPGDITGDGKVNVTDVALLYAHVKGSTTVTNRGALKAADYNADGKINVMDVAELYTAVKG